MNCPNCNNPINDGDRFCQSCGAAVAKPEPAVDEIRSDTSAVKPEPTSRYEADQKSTAFYSAPQQNQNGSSQQYAYTAPAYTAPKRAEITEDDLPPHLKPIGAWKYFAYQLLFSIPIVGFVFLIVFSCSSANINRRNFARSYWCALVVAAAIAVIILIMVILLGIGTGGLIRGYY